LRAKPENPGDGMLKALRSKNGPADHERKNQQHHENYDKDNEQNFGNPGSRRGNPGKALEDAYNIRQLERRERCGHRYLRIANKLYVAADVDQRASKI
jgi:hypothetical protein